MSEMYQPLFYIHVTSAILSIAFFTLRGAWMISGSALLHSPLVRITPHVIDTILLASAICLTILIGQFPFEQGWLTAKLFALLLYILVGSIALKRGGTRKIRIFAFALSLCIVLYIVSVAYFHDSRGILSLFI